MEETNRGIAHIFGIVCVVCIFYLYIYICLYVEIWNVVPTAAAPF